MRVRDQRLTRFMLPIVCTDALVFTTLPHLMWLLQSAAIADRAAAANNKPHRNWAELFAQRSTNFVAKPCPTQAQANAAAYTC